MSGFFADFENLTDANGDVRHLLHTVKNLKPAWTASTIWPNSAPASSEHRDGKITR